MFDCYFEVDALVNILKMKFDQDLCKNLRYDIKKLL